jgi:hypothetical protein
MVSCTDFQMKSSSSFRAQSKAAALAHNFSMAWSDCAHFKLLAHVLILLPGDRPTRNNKSFRAKTGNENENL